MIRIFLHEMVRTFPRAMEYLRVFLGEMSEAEKADYFISGRSQKIMISTFGT